MDVSAIISALGALGGIGAVAAMLKIVPEVRKLRADTGKIDAETEGVEQDAVAVLSKTALAQMDAAVARATRAETDVERYRQDNAGLRDEFAAHKRECTDAIAGLERAMQDYRRAAQDHVAWDVQRIRDAERVGLPAPPDAPPLLPRSVPRP